MHAQTTGKQPRAVHFRASYVTACLRRGRKVNWFLQTLATNNVR